mgnify:CR=1 FL=1
MLLAADGDGVGDNADYAPNDPAVQSAPTPEQQISVSGTTIAARGGSFTLDISYDVSSNENQLSGLGLRIHYDSTKLEFTGVNNPLLTDKIVDTYSSEMDFDDLDANSATDSYVTIAWASINETGVPSFNDVKHTISMAGYKVVMSAIQEVKTMFSLNNG